MLLLAGGTLLAGGAVLAQSLGLGAGVDDLYPGKGTGIVPPPLDKCIEYQASACIQYQSGGSLLYQ